MVGSPSKVPAVPACIHHKATGQAMVKIEGRCLYLGAYGSEEANQRYRQLAAEFLASGGIAQVVVPTVDHVIAGYWKHAEVYYQKNGKPTSELAVLRVAMRHLHELFGGLTAAEFGPLRLKACREQMIEAGLARTTINGFVSRIRQAFAWAVENEIVPGSVLQGLKAVAGLKQGRSRAKECERVQAVDRAAVEAVLPHVSRQVAAMIELQWLTGMRPQEVVQMRMAEIDRGGRVWLYRPRDHKVEHHGMQRVVPLGPKAQACLAPFVSLDPLLPLFSPREAERDRRAAIRAARKTKLWPSHARRQEKRPKATKARVVRECYDTASYRRAIARACKAAGIASWSPNQLRHAAATRIRKEMGIEAAQAVLGHRQLDTTQVYAQVNQGRAVEAMERLG